MKSSLEQWEQYFLADVKNRIQILEQPRRDLLKETANVYQLKSDIKGLLNLITKLQEQIADLSAQRKETNANHSNHPNR